MPPDVVAEPAVVTTGPMTPRMYEVESRREDLADTVTLTLAPTGEPIAPPEPGQFTMLWAFGIGEAPISLAGSDGALLTHTIRRVGAVTRALCDAGPGDQIGVRGPYGVGWQLPAAAGTDVLIVAGGLGLAPLRPLVEQVAAQRDRFRQATLLIGARSPGDLLYLSEVDTWRRHAIDVEITVDVASTDWTGHVGVVTFLIDKAAIDPSATTAFVCGPEVMMRFGAQAIADRGVLPSSIQLSLERNMHCAIGHCGHCQLGPAFVCKDGPVLQWSAAEPLMRIRAR